MPFENLSNAAENDRLVMLDGKRKISSLRLHEESLKLAQYFQESGMKPGDRVLLVIPPGIEFVIITYALSLIHAMVAIIDPEMGRANYLKKLEQLDPKYAFIDSRLTLLDEHPLLKFMLLLFNKSIPDIPPIRNCQLFTVGLWLPIFTKHRKLPRYRVEKKPGGTPHPLLAMRARSDEGILITYTSGTLNEPKGVVHSEQSLNRSIELLTQLLNKGNNHKIATHLPHFILLGIKAGLQVLLWDNTWTPTRKLAFIEKHQITTLFGPPADFLPLLLHLEQSKFKFPTCLENIYLGSAPLFTAFLNRILACCGKTQVTCLYGMTENLMVCHQDAREKIKLEGDGDLVGTPFEGVKLKIALDGEVMLQSDQMFKGYDRMNPHDGPHATGDLGRLDEKGRLWLLGRKKDMIIRRNFNLYPGLYEPTINRIPGIHAAAMVGIYREKLADEEVFLVIEGEPRLRASTIRTLLQRGQFAIDKEALPDHIIFHSLHRSGRQQKVDRKALRAYCAEVRAATSIL